MVAVQALVANDIVPPLLETITDKYVLFLFLKDLSSGTSC
jgi:hypothetical protein